VGESERERDDDFEIVTGIIKELEETGPLCDPRQRRRPFCLFIEKTTRFESTASLKELLRNAIEDEIDWLIVQNQLFLPKREPKECGAREAFEAALLLRKVWPAYGGDKNLTNLSARLEDGTHFRTVTRADQEATAAQLRKVAKFRPEIAERLIEVASELEQDARRGPSRDSIAQPGMQLKLRVAYSASELIKAFTQARPSKTKGGMFQRITELLYRAVTGEEASVTRACTALLNSQGRTSEWLYSKLTYTLTAEV
jgi:hypothetical protein